MILNKDYIEQQDLASCEKLLKQALKNPDIYLELALHPHLHQQADELANTICYLEQRIDRLSQLENLAKASATRWGKTLD